MATPLKNKENDNAKRKLCGLEVSAIGFGCLGLSHGYVNQSDRKEVVRVLRDAARGAGVWPFDTALGESLKNPTLQMLAKQYGKTAAQLILRWHIQLGNIPLCKSVTPPRIRENLEIFDFRIDADDMERIATLEGDPNGAPSRTLEASLPRWQS